MNTNGRETAVEVKKLRRTFGEFVAVNDIDLSVQKGEIFGFLGPNGAGKSTVIRMLCGLLMPTGGGGTVGGYDIIGEAEEIKKHIGYMSQKFSLYNDLTVEENINFFAGVYGVDKGRRAERRTWALAMADLEERKTTMTADLPAGFKQRLALGCAILHEPPIIFLDEPTSGVDPISRRKFWDLIHDMAKNGTTVFITTHYMDEADYCNRLALIYRGGIIAEGTPGELRQKYMRRDILEVDVDQAIDAMTALVAHGVETAIFGSCLHATVDDADTAIPRIRAILAEAGTPAVRIEKIVPSLEDVFVTLIETA